ncbi:hypothetical protein [Bosea sp. NBC_00550]|jgi:hypothetical protein|uniref:hypothetical protein n=1 Tax=Bosea sp. NBC_00550 TaxID=2969621 RepID=UPI0022310770|nr:hypothetical protein [Bosea sp. NBC_00550]UZF91518.1 hypothetical protein NWE53_20730 [Bosea sp. NBC_00550]
MNESQALRGVSLGDGRMAIEGMSARYVQGATRRFRLTASGLSFVGGYDSRDGRIEDGQRLLAEAHVEGGALRRAGVEGEAGVIGLTLRPLSTTGEQTRLLLLLGYREQDGETLPFAEAFLAPAVFEALKADMLAGLARHMTLSATTNLWIREDDRDLAEASPIDWHLASGIEEGAVAPARGFIESIEWRPHASPAPNDEAALAILPAAVHDEEAEEDWRESSAEQLRKINWSFKQLLLLLAFLMIIIAVK